jgi:GTP cyclohydrolase I
MGTGNNVLTGGEVSLLICNANTLVTPVQRFLLWHESKSGHHGPLSELVFLQNRIFSHSAKFLLLVRSIPMISTCETQIRQQTMCENS